MNARIVRSLVTACIIASSGWGAAQAGTTQQTSNGRVVRFTAPFTDPGTRISGLEGCAPAQPGICSFSFHGKAGRFSGALATVVDYHGHGYFDPVLLSLRGESWDHHVGSLRGCGNGSFVLHQTNFRGGPTTLDPGTRAMRITLDWTLVPGSGTGAFRDATGQGTAIVYFNAAGYSNSEIYLPNFGTYTGVIRC